jgi:hypothetical protein
MRSKRRPKAPGAMHRKSARREPPRWPSSGSASVRRSSEGEWRLAADKARRWLSRVQAMPAGGGEWPAAAQRMLSTVTR